MEVNPPKKETMQIPTAERVRSLLDYCSITGELTWREYRNSQAVAGQVAGHVDSATGYLVIGIDHKVHQAHMVIWLHHYGHWPSNDIDHENRVRTDNRIHNLRCVSRRVNCKNKSKSKRNSTGHTGVYKTPAGKWIARICVDFIQVNLGTFPSIDEALVARKAAEVLHQFHPTHGL